MRLLLTNSKHTPAHTHMHTVRCVIKYVLYIVRARYKNFVSIFRQHSYNYCFFIMVNNKCDPEKTKCYSVCTDFVQVEHQNGYTTLYVNCTVSAEFVNKIIHSPVFACLPGWLAGSMPLLQLSVKENSEVYHTQSM